MTLLVAFLLWHPAMAEEPQPTIDEEPVEELVVWGEHQLRHARRQIAKTMEALGWKSRNRDGDLVFVPPSSWMGRAHLHQDGTMTFGRPIVAYRTTSVAFDPEYDPDAVMDRTDQVALALGPKLTVPSKNRLAPIRAEVLAAIEPGLQEYRAMLQANAFQAHLQEVPVMLDRLWREGVGLDGETGHTDYAARRQAVLDFWSSRTATKEGDATSHAVEVWLRQTVQRSDHPLTDQEIADAEAARPDSRKLEP